MVVHSAIFSREALLLVAVHSLLKACHSIVYQRKRTGSIHKSVKMRQNPHLIPSGKCWKIRKRPRVARDVLNTWPLLAIMNLLGHCAKQLIRMGPAIPCDGEINVAAIGTCRVYRHGLSRIHRAARWGKHDKRSRSIPRKCHGACPTHCLPTSVLKVKIEVCAAQTQG